MAASGVQVKHRLHESPSQQSQGEQRITKTWPTFVLFFSYFFTGDLDSQGGCKSDSDLRQSLLSFHHGGPGSQTQGVRTGSRHLDHLSSPGKHVEVGKMSTMLYDSNQASYRIREQTAATSRGSVSNLTAVL